MTQVETAWFDRGVRRLRRRHVLAVIAAAGAAGLLLASAVWRLGARPATALALALAGALLTGFSLFPWGRSVISREALARHLNRTRPDLEESAHLLLVAADRLAPLAHLQRQRVAARLSGPEAFPPLPHGVYRGPLRWSLGAALLAAVIAMLPAGATGSTAVRSGGPGHASPSDTTVEPPAVALHQVTIVPPGYTGLPARRETQWDIEAEEGAAVTWAIGARGAAGGRLITAAGDTFPLVADGERLTARLNALRSTLYRVHLNRSDGASAGFADHRLIVRPDAPPLLTVVTPDSRTVVPPGGSMRLPVEVLARDDYGVDSVAIVATVSKGQGEGVKFREQRLGFTVRERRAEGGLILRRTLDLAALGLEPGDELYFHVTATDRRTPTPNESRSETIFVTLVDTTRTTIGPGTGVALDVAPDYFRSQRQLIIDTETLLADQPRLMRDLFQNRSNGLGIDQGLLRLRYGQFMGDEFEGEMPASGREQHADDHDHDQDLAPPAPPVAGEVAIPGEAPRDLLAELTHDHDDPENATLLAPQVKARLRDAITAMWSAELHLRLGEPRKSLPFQHRALELLQEIRQDARAYVQRVGFEPPPLEPDRKRLTGDLSDIRAPTVHAAAARREPDTILRDGVRRLRRLATGGPVEPADVEQLELLGQEMARRAVEEAVWLLEPLRALREGIASLSGGVAECRDCLATAELGVIRALDAATPFAAAGVRSGPGLAARYRQLLAPPR